MEASNGKRPLAVVTGASSGIGFHLADTFAENGFDLIINAEDDLDQAERELSERGVEVKAVRADLAEESGVSKLYKRIRSDGRPVEALAINAGIGAGGDFARQTDLSQELELVDLNVRSTVHLSKLVLEDMVKRDRGRVLITSSVAATMPGSYQAVYNASKSFVQSFALGLRDEFRDTKVSVTSLMPGPTETEFFERAHMEDTPVGEADKDDPAKVARQGFRALMAGRERVVAGSLVNKLRVLSSRFIPDRAKALMHRRMAEPGGAR